MARDLSEWRTADGWQPKPTNWRTRYWHRPPSYTCRNDSDDLRRIASEYCSWLDKQFGDKSSAHLAAQHSAAKGLVSVVHYGGPTPFLDSVAPPKPKRAPTPKPEAKMTDTVVPFTPVREPAPAHASEAGRRQAAAELLREIAGNYGPRRAHKLRAMADWLVGVPVAPAQRAAQ